LDGEWLTYAQASERLGVSPVAVRFRAIRGRWQRVIGNDGRTRVCLPNGEHTVSTLGERSASARAVRTASARASNDKLIKSLEAHINTLKEQLSVAEAQLIAERETTEVERARAEKQAADFAERDAQRAADLAAERAKTEKAIADFAALVDKLTTLADEKAKTDRAIAAFESLAQRLEAMAEARRPLWHRLLWRA
jgi:hypothetical protein